MHSMTVQFSITVLIQIQLVNKSADAVIKRLGIMSFFAHNRFHTLVGTNINDLLAYRP
jgi:hypothetical protein